MAARRTLKCGSLSHQFWERCDAKYKNAARKKRKGTISFKRVTACTEKMAKQHIDDLAQVLIDCGIFTNAHQVESGSWTGQLDETGVFNHDKTPQFLNYGVDGSATKIYYSGKGERCTGILAENRECVTISPMISSAGDVCMCHVIFASGGIKSQKKLLNPSQIY